MNKTIGFIIKFLAFASFVIAMIWALWLDIRVIKTILAEASPFLDVLLIIGFIVLLPITIFGCLIYALISWGEWLPFAVALGGWALSASLYYLGKSIAKDMDI